MGLYSSFDPSQYYDEPVVKKQPQPEINKPQEFKKPNQPTISETKRRSLYEEAKKVASSASEYKGPDFRNTYRVGQRVAIKAPNGTYRTANGLIAEIIDKNLMYVYMQDSYKDVNEQWMVDFVTDKDTIIPL